MLVYSKSFGYHISHLQQILQRFKEREIKLKPSKCKFFQKQVTFPGHVFIAEGYKVDPSLTKPITKFLADPPRDIASVRRILRLLGYFHRHIQSFT